MSFFSPRRRKNFCDRGRAWAFFAGPRYVARMLEVCLFLGLACSCAAAFDSGRTIAQFAHTAWGPKDGAPSEVHALAQTTDGYLWLGTATGLFRFDGVRFERYQQSSKQSFLQRNVYSLFASPDGGLWVSYWYGGVSFIRDGKVTNYGTEDGLPSHAVLAFARDRKGVIWIAAGNDGLARLEGSRWKKIGNGWGFTDPANTVFVDRSGTVWVGTPSRVEYLREGAKQFQIAADHLQIVMKFAEAPDGTLWMAETRRGVRPVPIPWKKNASTGPEILIGSQAMAVDNRGSLWITSLGDGIRRVPYPERLGSSVLPGSAPEIDAFTHQRGLSADFVYCVLQDHEENIWIGTSGGLDRFRQSAFVSVSVPTGSTVSALATGDQGSLWVASIGPPFLFELENDKIVFQRLGPFFDCAYRDPHGVIWLAAPDFIARLDDGRSLPFGSYPGEIAYSYRGGVTAASFRSSFSLNGGARLRQLELPTQGGITVSAQSRVKTMTEDRSGRLWVSMGSGTFRLEKSGWSSLESLGGPRGTAASEFTDPDGRVWFGFANSVVMLEGDRVTTYSGKDGVQVGTVTSITSEGQRIWIGGELGLEYFDCGGFHLVNADDGTSFGGISGIIDDPGNGLWFSENRGVIQIPESELQHLGSGHKAAYEVYGLLDGLNSEIRGLASPPVTRTTDGRIWFATTEGLAWIDPERIPRNTVPPPVLIESIVANGTHYEPSTPLKLLPRTRNLQIVYTATSLTIPERVRFRYKLEGQDTEWQDAGTRREAFYTGLGPGHYHFRVIACNNDGVWNEAGAYLDFVILPAWYQTIWFQGPCLLGFCTLLWAGYQMRVHELQEQEKKFRDAVETMPALAFVADPRGSRTFLNRGWLEYAGLSSEQASGSGWQAAVHPDDLKRVNDRWSNALATGEPLDYEARLRRGSDGTYRWFQTRARPLRDNRGKIVKWCGVANDIEDRKRVEQLQADLTHASRVSTMGELVASISHELAQPITATTNNAKASLRWLQHEPPDLNQVRKGTESIIEASNFASEIINRLRSLYKKAPPKREFVSIRSTVAEMAGMMRGEARGHGISIRTDLDDDLPMTVADRVQLQQVFMNLMLNGIEAMKETGGVLTVKSQLRDDGQIEIAVKDTGPGLPPDKAEQIFDAFFTTKPEGSGMGLAICKSIIESQGGRIWADANSGRGATFHFTLPTAKSSSAEVHRGQ